MHKIFVLLLIFSFVVGINASEEQLTLQLTTKLGVQSIIIFPKVQECGNEALNRLAYDGFPNSIPIRVNEHVYLMILLSEIKRVDFTKNNLTVYLNDGAHYNGQIVNCSIKGRSSSGEDVSYKISSLTELKVKIRGEVSSYSPSVKSWKLEIKDYPKTNLNFVGYRPQFVFSSSAGYLIGRGVRIDKKFWIEIKGEEIDGNLSDFKRIAVEKGNSTVKGMHLIFITSPNGRENKGILRLKGIDSRGSHLAKYLGLVIDLKSYQRVRLFVEKELDWQLTR